jgi:signal transduction histidine kinase/DNA-binding response OmpR family regulator
MTADHRPDDPPEGRGADDTFLTGTGEIGALVRSIDWKKTHLGEIGDWPQSLRTTMSICLNSKFPIAVYWGPEYLMLYNESLVPMVGSQKHPLAMGQPARIVLAEIWDIIEPLLRKVRGTGEATWSEDLMLPLARLGRPEESYFTFTYSPIRDESGAVGGVFCAVVETTDKVIEGRRMRLLHALAAREGLTAAAACTHAAAQLARTPADVPFALLYLLDSSNVATLAGAARIVAGTQWAPITIRPGDESPWKFEDLRDARVAVWNTEGPADARGAVILPIEHARGGHRVGFIVAGLSPMLAESDSYTRFHTLLAASISQSVSSAASFEEERRRAESLASIDRAKTAFFSNISHEFRTPLTLMLGPVEDSLADKENPLAPPQRDRQEVVRRNGQRLLKLVNSLLDFSRIEAGRVRATYQQTDLGSLTSELASNFHSLLEKAGLALNVDCPALPQPIYVDRELWEKVVLNLLSNAFKFTFEGTVHVSMRSGDTHVVLEVADTGIGIPTEDLPRVFERFHRVEGARGRSYEGSGIGLALVQELVRLHGGVITVTSQLGKGTAFTVTLPLGHAHLPPEQVVPGNAHAKIGPAAELFVEEATAWMGDVEAPPENELAGPTTSIKAQGRILLADDNRDMREYIRKLLVKRGWSVDAVSNGEAALLSAHENRPDLVLADVMMPGVDGFELMRALRADETLRDIPCILLSARAGEEAKVEAIEAGADDYLVKPFSARELVSRIAARLEVAYAHAETRAARSRLHAQLMQAPVAVSVLRGPQLIFELANTRYLEMVGRKGQRVEGRRFREVFTELPNDAPVFAMLENIYRTAVPFTADEYCVPLERGGGELENVYFQFTSEPIKDAAGQVTEIMTVAVEVTAQVLARQRIQVLLGELKMTDQRKDEFLAMLAHELRNPMASISMALAMMEQTAGDEPKIARYRETAKRQVGTLVRLVDDLLDVSRITRGVVELRKTEVNLSATIANAVAATRGSIESRQHELTVTVGPGTFPIQADSTRLEQVITNLLNNAARYAEPGGVISLHLMKETVGDLTNAVIRVRDSGRGIPKDMLEKVFDLFVQVDQTIDRRTGGLGLGLTLVKRLVELHGGSVQARSDGEGKGTEFLVRLPLSLASQAATEKTPTPSPIGTVPLHRKHRVVVVEDSDDLGETIKEFLESLGHDVELATNGLDGVDKIVRARPDIAFIDIGIPGIDGYEVARRVRSALKGHKIRLVALTGYGDPSAQAAARSAGFDVHATKPLNATELSKLFDA